MAPADVLADFLGSIDRPGLVLYVSGNYFFAMTGLVETFGNAYPQYRGLPISSASAGSLMVCARRPDD